jgi:acyl transferase domain-containing protein
MSFSPIAIVGAGAIMPDALDLPGFWKNILAKRDCIKDTPPGHWRIEDYYDADPKAPDKTYAKRGAFLPDVPFDAMGFGVPPSILPATDTSQLLALIVAKMVLDDVGRSGEDLSRTSVILGVTGAQELLGSLVSRLQRPVWERSLRELGWAEDEVQAACKRMAEHYVGWQESSFPGLLGNVVAGRIANRLDVGMTNCVTDAACASALTAVHMGVLELQTGHSDMVITGGVDTMNDIFMYMCFSKTPALSPTGDCRPFDATGDGTLLGEGIGMVALKRLADAERDGDKVYAVIRGLGSSSDGRAKSVYAPVSEGQARAVRQAYAQAGYGPETVQLMEAHGTATKAGDAAELRGLQLVFPTTGGTQYCALGSVKSQIGHAKAAAGVAGLLKVVCALQHRTLPPTIKVQKPSSAVDWPNSPFYVNTEARPWVRPAGLSRRAGVSSFGFGGSNFHVAVEEYVGPAPRPARMDVWDSELVVIGAESREALLQRLAAARGGDVAALAVASQLDGSASAPVRVALVVKGDLDTKLDRAIEAVREGRESARGDVFFSPEAQVGPVAFLFPGQGSQALDMGAELHRFDVVADTLDEAEAALPGLAGVLYPIPTFSPADRKAQEARLTATEWAQPALGAVSVAMARLLGALGLVADMAGGHSFGELTALHAAGAFDFSTLVAAARKRGELMAAAAAGAPGAMAAVMGPSKAVAAHLGEGVVLANLNAPEQTVIAGGTADVERAMARLDAAGLRCTRLPVATAFHSPIVAPAGAALRDWLAGQKLGATRFPVYRNTTATPHKKGLPAALGEHLQSPVRWVEQIETMYAAGARVFVEVGPGSVLTGLVARILAGRPHVAVSLEAKGRGGVESLQAALGRLVSIGVSVNLAPLTAGRTPGPTRFVAKPGSVLINGANYGKPYPRPDSVSVPPNPSGRRPGAAPAAAAAPAAPAAAAAPAPSAAPAVAKAAAAAEVRPSVPSARPPAAPTAAPASSVAAPPARAMAAPLPSPVAAGPTPRPAVSAPPARTPESRVNDRTPAAHGWIAAFQENQRQLAEAHERFARSMADTHMAFLRSQEVATQGLVAMVTGQAMPAPAAYAALPAAPPAPAYAPAPVYAAPPAPAYVAPPAPAYAPPPAPAYAAPPAPPAPVYAAPPAPAYVAPPAPPAPAYVAPPAPAAPAVAAVPVAAAAAPRPSTAAPAAVRDLPALLLAVVGDKTGYPVEMLRLDMNLEADLGIDSIKRVEILSALREQAPELPEPDAETLGKLNTLGQIVEVLGGSAAAPASAPAVNGAAPRPSTAATAAGRDLPALLLAVVGDKTGYPVKMLRLDMNLEADLGIDSIKRVEILSALREQAPELPEPDAETLGKLNTLGQIVEVLGGTAAAPAAAPAPNGVAPAATNGTAHRGPNGTLDLPALLLAVVGDKTGYPVEMLRLDMNLEADLGIDSIKRVEILSALREQAPELPEPDAETLGKLNTLGQIVEVLHP